MRDVPEHGIKFSKRGKFSIKQIFLVVVPCWKQK